MNNWLKNIQYLFDGRQACLLCQQRVHGQVCSACLADLPWLVENVCRQCAIPLPAGDRCARCLDTSPSFDASLALFHYADPVEWMIKQLKFHRGLVYGKLLGRLMGERLPLMAGFCRPDVIIPVPLHERRLTMRGYNQAYVLAQHLGECFSLSPMFSCVEKVRETQEQSGLSADDRRYNLSNAFIVKENVENKHIAIVDDVMTTGATANELAKLLKENHAKRVDVWVCARS